ncbi:MAG: extracellular solute-binding protein, partial [Clostridia bacterium]|nr:extracellular solute-binding protein [Clostridia bacterium]
MKKRLVSLLVCGVLTASAVAGLTACGGGDKIKLTVWGSAAQQETLKQMVAKFEEANPDKKYDIKIGISEEQFAYEDVQRDPDSAADVFNFSNDQLIPLLRVGGLARIGGTYLETIKANNDERAIASGSIKYGTDDEKVYGYPFSSDNGYYLYYDKSVLSETDVEMLETIISVCEARGKKIVWALDDP